MSTTPEGKVKAAVKKLLHSMDVMPVPVLMPHQDIYFMPPTGGVGASGQSDFLLCIRGYFAAVEAKSMYTRASRKGPTALQRQFLTSVTNAHGATLVVNEMNLDDVRALVQRLRDCYVASKG